MFTCLAAILILIRNVLEVLLLPIAIIVITTNAVVDDAVGVENANMDHKAYKDVMDAEVVMANEAFKAVLVFKAIMELKVTKASMVHRALEAIKVSMVQ